MTESSSSSPAASAAVPADCAVTARQFLLGLGCSVRPEGPGFTSGLFAAGRSACEVLGARLVAENVLEALLDMGLPGSVRGVSGLSVEALRPLVNGALGLRWAANLSGAETPALSAEEWALLERLGAAVVLRSGGDFSRLPSCGFEALLGEEDADAVRDLCFSSFGGELCGAVRAHVGALAEDPDELGALLVALLVLETGSLPSGLLLPESLNLAWGFMGEALRRAGPRRAVVLWDFALVAVVLACGCSAPGARAWLDSAAGRHLADRLAEDDLRSAAPASLLGLLLPFLPKARALRAAVDRCVEASEEVA